MKKLITRCIATLIAPALLVGCFGGGSGGSSEGGGKADFKTMADIDNEIIASGKPICFEINQFYDSNFFRLEVARVLMFDEYTQLEIYAENDGWKKASRDFYSFTDNRDEGFYIQIGEEIYKSTTINNKYTFPIKSLAIGEKRLLVVNFEPIPRNTKTIALMTGRDKYSNPPNKVKMQNLQLGRPDYIEADFVADWAQREFNYKSLPQVIYTPNAKFEDKDNEIELTVSKVKIDYSRTYVDLEIKNYAQRITYELWLNIEHNGILNISVPNHVEKLPVSRIAYKGRIEEFNHKQIKIAPNSTDRVTLVFNTVPRNSRRIIINGLLDRNNSYSIQLKKEL